MKISYSSGESIGLKFILNQSEKVLYFIWWKTVKNQFELIRLIPRQQSEWIRTNLKPSIQSRSFRAQINPNRIFNQNQSERIKVGIIRIDFLPFFIKRPWRRYRIGIHSEPIRTIPNHSDIWIGVNANHSEPIRKSFVSRLMKNGQKSIEPNPI